MPSQPIMMDQGEDNKQKQFKKQTKTAEEMWALLITHLTFIAMLHSQPTFIIFADWIFRRKHTIMNR